MSTWPRTTTADMLPLCTGLHSGIISADVELIELGVMGGRPEDVADCQLKSPASYSEQPSSYEPARHRATPAE